MKYHTKKMCGHRINQRRRIANYILFATFCLMGTIARRKKTWRYRKLLLTLKSMFRASLQCTSLNAKILYVLCLFLY